MTESVVNAAVTAFNSVAKKLLDVALVFKSDEKNPFVEVAFVTILLVP